MRTSLCSFCSSLFMVFLPFFSLFSAVSFFGTFLLSMSFSSFFFRDFLWSVCRDWVGLLASVHSYDNYSPCLALSLVVLECTLLALLSYQFIFALFRLLWPLLFLHFFCLSVFSSLVPTPRVFRFLFQCVSCMFFLSSYSICLV